MTAHATLKLTRSTLTAEAAVALFLHRRQGATSLQRLVQALGPNGGLTLDLNLKGWTKATLARACRRLEERGLAPCLNRTRGGVETARERFGATVLRLWAVRGYVCEGCANGSRPTRPVRDPWAGRDVALCGVCAPAPAPAPARFDVMRLAEGAPDWFDGSERLVVLDSSEDWFDGERHVTVAYLVAGIVVAETAWSCPLSLLQPTGQTFHPCPYCGDLSNPSAGRCHGCYAARGTRVGEGSGPLTAAGVA